MRKSAIFSILILLALCVVGTFIAYQFITIPNRAADLFGPPATSSPLLVFNQAREVLQYAPELTAQGPPGTAISFSINPGESTASIIQRLEDLGLVNSQAAFRAFLVYSGKDTRLQPGMYRIQPGTSLVEIASILENRSQSQVLFNILPGWRIEEIAAALPTSGLAISPAQFIAAAYQHPRHFGMALPLPDHATGEGFMLPGSYWLDRGSSLESLLGTLYTSFQSILNDELVLGFAKQGLDIYQGVTLASIVQREALVAEEQPLIASVYLNRLSIDMMLQADPTVQYALGYQAESKSWWKSPLSLADLQAASRYNTYQHTGLPPGPIANPGMNAIQAVADPAASEYYFFRAACDGSGRHLFAITFDEHLSNACP